MPPALLMLMLLATPQQTTKLPTPPVVAQEIQRLAACHPAFKLATPPVNLKVVWTQPFDLIWSMEDKNHVSIEFSVQYAQSDFFKTREEAEHTQDFTPMFNLRQRSHYELKDGHLSLLWRESLLNGKWKRQTTTASNLACWQTLPNVPHNQPSKQ